MVMISRLGVKKKKINNKTVMIRVLPPMPDVVGKGTQKKSYDDQVSGNLNYIDSAPLINIYQVFLNNEVVVI